MRDPNLIETPIQRIPDEWRRRYLQRPIDKLPGDVAHAFDLHYALNKEKNELRADLIQAKRDLGFANLKIWALMLIVTGKLAWEAGLLRWIFRMVIAPFAPWL